jgi:hypothetical protein
MRPASRAQALPSPPWLPESALLWCFCLAVVFLHCCVVSASHNVRGTPFCEAEPPITFQILSTRGFNGKPRGERGGTTPKTDCQGTATFLGTARRPCLSPADSPEMESLGCTHDQPCAAQPLSRSFCRCGMFWSSKMLLRARSADSGATVFLGHQGNDPLF